MSSEPVIQCYRVIDQWRSRAARLLARAPGNALPMIAALGRAFRIKFNEAKLGQDWRNSFYAELGGFLNNEIHALAA